MTVLLGNTYPPALVRRRVVVTPITIKKARTLLKDGFESFWGHPDTIEAGTRVLGVDVSPKMERPAIVLNATKLPTLNGKIANRVVVLSPNYIDGFRPAIGTAVPPDKITGWQCLLWEFEN